MQFAKAYRFLPCLMAGFLVTPFVTSCTTNSLTTQSGPNVNAVSKIGQEASLTEGTNVVTTPLTPANDSVSSTIVGTPANPAATAAGSATVTETTASTDIAQEKPAQPAANPVLLASVPRTPVANRPTNQIMMVRTTAYTHTESDHIQYGRKNAIGTTLQYGSKVRSAAADWSKYPVGTRFMIEGLPYEYVVDDYGSALVGTETIDIYKPEKSTMGHWGVRNVPIKVIEWGSFEESRKILDGRKHVRHADHVREMLHEIEKKGRNGTISLAPTGTSA